MASMTMTAPFLSGSSATITKELQTTIAGRRGPVMVRASKVSEAEKIVMNNKEERSNGRRDLVFAVAAAAAACTLAKAALADEVEPKPGTPEAKKKYGPVCVTMPTAKICHK